jgi:hypothetical protein
VSAVAILDRFNRVALLGLQLRDVATGRIVAEDLDVAAAPVGGRAIELIRNGRSVWSAPRLPGLRDADLDLATGSMPVRHYLLAVDDPLEDFLPLRLDLALPRRGLYTWDGWSGLPSGPLAPLRDEPGGIPSPNALPLFSSPSRAAPIGYGAIRGQLQRADTAGPGAWTLLAAEVDGQVRGLGLSDAEGRFALFLPWPEWPRANLPSLSPPSPPASPPAPIPAAPSWTVTVSAYSSLLSPLRIPSLPETVAQLASPRELLASTQSPLEPLAPQALQFGRPLTLRTDRTPDGTSSFLIMAAA